MSNSRHTSKTLDWWTPHEYIEAARGVLQEFDLDPASTRAANERVKAKHFFGPGATDDNGLAADWFGRVFVNPPGGRCDSVGRSVERAADGSGLVYDDGSPCTDHTQSSAKAWWRKLADEYLCGNVEAAIFVGFSIEILQSAQTRPLSAVLPTDFPLCIPSRRIAFVDPLTREPVKGMTHASVIVCLPPAAGGSRKRLIERFARAFANFGVVIGGV